MSLIERLRQRIKDDRPHHKALSLSVTEENVNSAIVELDDGHLTVTVSGGGAPSINWNLSQNEYATIGNLYKALLKLPGYLVDVDNDASMDRLSIDLQYVSPTNISSGNTAVEFKHYLFSVVELETILTEAIQRHNPSFTLDTLPQNEEIFVLNLAHADVCRRQAYDSSKRKGLSETVDDLLNIANSLESTYSDDIKRLARAIRSPREANSNLMHEGDVVIGTLHRTSLRTGFKSPVGQNIPPAQAVLKEPDTYDIEDDNIKVKWERNKNDDFYAAELWIDTRPEVERDQSQTIISSLSNVVTDLSIDFRHKARPTTSKLVFRARSPSSFETSSFPVLVEEFGQSITSYIIGDLESETEYFVRLFISDLNGEITGSEVIRYRTKPLRVQFAETEPVSPTTGDVSSTVTLNFDSDKGQFTTDHKIVFGGKDISAVTIIDPYQVTFIVPSFENKLVKKDVAVISPTGLVSVVHNVFKVN